MGFELYHPMINLLYFISVIVGTCMFRQPVFLLISFISAFAYSVKRNRIRALIFNLILFPLIVVYGLYYASYHHFGITNLKENFIGNQLTLESFFYGLTLGCVIAGIIMWFSCVHVIFSTDKVVYLFGRISPKLSLFLSITLRMVPRIKNQARKIHMARKAIGRGLNQGNVFERIRNALAIFSILVTWLLESLGTTSDSMKNRGYTLPGRTAFSIYRFDNRDRTFVIGLFACLTVTMMGVLLGQTDIRFDPRIIMNPITPVSAVFYMGYAALCLLPMVLELISEWQFKRLRNGSERYS